MKGILLFTAAILLCACKPYEDYERERQEAAGS